MKKFYSFVMAAAVVLTASANTNVAKVSVKETASDNVTMKLRKATESTDIKPAYAPDYGTMTWKSLGKGQYASSVVADIYGGSNSPVDVEVFEAEGQAGVYKVVGVWPDIVKSGKAELIVDASNPDFILVPKQNTGINDSVDGTTYIASQTYVFTEIEGYSPQVVAAALPELLPTLKDGVIFFPVQSLALNWPEADINGQYQTDPEGWYIGKNDGYLVLPGGQYNDPWESMGDCEISGDILFTSFGQTPVNYTVPAFKSTDRDGLIRIDDYLKGLYAALDFNAVSPSMEMDISDETNVVIPETKTGINGGDAHGLYYLMSVSANYPDPSTCPEANRGTVTKTSDQTIIKFPAKGLFLWPSNTTSLYYANTTEVVFTITHKNEGVKDVVTAADENAPVEYYNLQGVRVDNPAAGSLVIRRQGANVTKVLVK